MQLRDDTPVKVRDLLDYSLHNFYPQRFEYEWSMIAYIRYAFPLPEWKNKYGEKLTADRCVEELTRHKLELGPCNGLHRLEALVLLYRADEQFKTLSPATKRRILAYLGQVSQRLQSAQNTAGFWTRHWVEGTAGAADENASLSDKILVTGHQLEWLALAPEDVLPPREQIIRACQWLARTIPELEDRELRDHYGPFSHAARALCLWRSREPYSAWREGTSP